MRVSPEPPSPESRIPTDATLRAIMTAHSRGPCCKRSHFALPSSSCSPSFRLVHSRRARSRITSARCRCAIGIEPLAYGVTDQVAGSTTPTRSCTGRPCAAAPSSCWWMRRRRHRRRHSIMRSSPRDLSTALKRKVLPLDLPFNQFTYNTDLTAIEFQLIERECRRAMRRRPVPCTAVAMFAQGLHVRSGISGTAGAGAVAGAAAAGSRVRSGRVRHQRRRAEGVSRRQARGDDSQLQRRGRNRRQSRRRRAQHGRLRRAATTIRTRWSGRPTPRASRSTRSGPVSGGTSTTSSHRPRISSSPNIRRCSTPSRETCWTSNSPSCSMSNRRRRRSSTPRCFRMPTT